MSASSFTFCGVSSTTRTLAALTGPRSTLSRAAAVRARSSPARSRTTLQSDANRLDELPETDRLRDVAIEAGVGDIAAMRWHHRGGDRDDGNRRRRRLGTQLAKRFDAIDTGQLD